MIAQLETPQILACSEIRGGNRKLTGAGKLPGIVAWVASIPLDDSDGRGDLHFVSVCSHHLLSRIALADGSGHGKEIDALTMTLHELMRKNIDVWGPSDFMRGLNDRFKRDGGGQDLRCERLLKWACQSPVQSAIVFGQELLRRLSEFRGNRHNDDETLLVLQGEQESSFLVNGPTGL